MIEVICQSLGLCRQESMKRRISPPRNFQSPCYVLFYIPGENKYVVISTASTLFPKTMDLESIKPLQEVTLRDQCGEFLCRYISHSPSNDEMKVRQARLQRFIDSGRHVDADTSLRFLHDSFDMSVRDEVEAGCSFDEPVAQTEPTVEPPEETSPMVKINQQLHVVIKCLEENNRLLKDNLKENIKIKKLLRVTRDHSAVTQTYGLLDSQEGEERSPVIYNGVDMLKIKPFNLDVSNYAIKVARLLWSDSELKNSRLLPKRETGRKGSMSPERTKIFKNAIEGRFSADETQMASAIAAVNQLGSDLTRGKRVRKD